MKIELELLLAAIITIVVVSLSFYFVSPNVDDYWHFSLAKWIAKDPSILITTVYPVESTRFVEGPNGVLIYPILMHIMLVPFVMLGAEKIFFILMFSIFMLLMWKWEKRAIPFLFLSFALTRISVFGGIDLVLMVMAVGCIYFFDKKPIVSGVFAGLAPLVKGFGFMILLGYIISIIAYNRKSFRTNKKIFVGIIVALLITSTWYVRNLMCENWNIMTALTSADIGKINQILNTGFQATQPERNLWDETGYYPLPIDLLLYVGIAFTAFNIYKKKKILPEHVFILIAISAYFLMHFLNITLLMVLRYYLFIFPFLAVQIARSLSEKQLRYAYVVTMIFFVFFIYSLQNYQWNAFDAQLKTSGVCQTIKNNVGNNTVYIKAFQDLFIIWECGLTYQAVIENESVWTVDFYNGTIYKTNTTGV